MELEEENSQAVWCLVATLRTDEAGGGAGSKGARAFAPGCKVYCFPPMRSGAYESVKVVGPTRRGGKLAAEVVAADDLCDWKAERVADPEVLRQIAPPWDAGDVSCDVAKGIAGWKGGGPWPAAQLREWNRQNAQKRIGDGTLLSRVRETFTRLLGRDRP